MLDDLQSRYRSRFVDGARARLTRMRAATADLATVSAELRALAGEAAFLQFARCAAVARQADLHARSGEGRKCRDLLGALEEAVSAVSD